MGGRFVSVDGRVRLMSASEFWALRNARRAEGRALPRTVRFEDDGAEDACPTPRTSPENAR